ncbi:hypothetical protein [Pedobacter cryoconitis]|uniref:Peptidase S74 domain-containing protein n=1 Tax=Pedobacter cryoconitis TaxID=188932 RepID=A0A7X0MKN5_9SPHI|nr:hypothetical protein [Pedobacter cryoconitis]MBB6502261.1 hypothetical protein [Pedobacter cryoconitis]
MRKLLFAMLASFAVTGTAKAQFTTSGNITSTGNNVGIGTSLPNGKLDVNGAILVLGSSGNSMIRPVVGNSRLAGEIGAYSGLGFGADDGFLRLSAGAGSSANVKTFIDLSAYSTVPDMDRNIVLGTGGIEQVRVNSSGNMGIGTNSPNAKLDVNGAILVAGSSSNAMVRPAIGNLRVTGEIGSYSNTALGSDDGFLRLSAGAGSNANVKTFIDLTGYSTVPDMDRNLVLGTGGTERIRINSSGNVGIGTTHPDAKLAVGGVIHAQSVKVDMTGWGDDVFNDDYSLSDLKDVKNYIDENHHLPGIPSESQVIKNGIDVGEMNKVLIRKIEELTLYLIGQNEEINKLKQEMKAIGIKTPASSQL